MRPPSHIVRLYNRTVRKYRKLTTRLNRYADPDSFSYRTLVSKLRKLRRKLTDLQYQLKIGVAAGAIVFASALQEAQAQTNPGPFIRQPRDLNPLREPFYFQGASYPAVSDLDGDGDLDILVGQMVTSDGMGEPLRYLLNAGTAQDPRYVEKTDLDDLFPDTYSGNNARGPVFIDFDGDGDEDLFMATDVIRYYRNDDGTFQEQDGFWDPIAGTGNPFGHLSACCSGWGNIKLALGDVDGDGDLDAVAAGGDFGYGVGSILYLRNDDGYYTDATEDFVFTTEPPSNQFLSPALVDIDEDGQLDLVLGYKYSGSGLVLYLQTDDGEFEEQTEPWDPVAKTGDPFENFKNDPWRPILNPTFADLDGDGDLDLLAGAGNGFDAYIETSIRYFINEGNNVFTEQIGLDNPFSGVDVDRGSAPVLVDFDADGDLDAVVGHKYGNDSRTDLLEYYRREEDGFHFVEDEDSPFTETILDSQRVPSFGDLDGDGDLDMVIAEYWGEVVYFANEDGAFIRQDNNNPFAGIPVIYRGSAQLVDLDGDGDLDLAMSDDYGLHFHENIGTTTAPEFEERPGDQSPFFGISPLWYSYVHFADVDHDGDLDLVLGEYQYEGYEFHINWYENTGSATEPVFTLSEVQPFPQTWDVRDEGRDVPPYLADYDGDGDLDLFTGNYEGTVLLFKNENPAPQVTLASGTLQYRVGIDTEMLVDETLQLSDEDDDLIVMATVSITNFEPGDKLDYPTPPELSSAFDFQTGVLTIRGTATAAEYQAVLRTVTFMHETTSPPDVGARKRPRAAATTLKAFEVRVFDTDFTTGPAATRPIEVITNTPPTFVGPELTTHAGASVTLDLVPLISDPDGNQNLESLIIVQSPESGATAEITPEHRLVVNYEGIQFVGTEQVLIEICDEFGTCAQSIVTIHVENQAPVFENHTVAVVVGQSVTVDLSALLTDPDGAADIDPTSLSIAEAPGSGAEASIAQGTLTIDYDGLSFSGTETVTISACDVWGACVEGVITINANNVPPQIADQPLAAPTNNRTVVNLLGIASDADGNLDPDGFTIVSQPASGAEARIEVVSGEVVNLIIDYAGIQFDGVDQLTIRSCDLAGACTEQILHIPIEITGTITVYNAIAPSSAGDNRFMRIANLPAKNRVRIYNRWGDLVFDMQDYNHTMPGRRFEGFNDSGNALASGTYFYKIEAVVAGGGQNEVTGYIVLKQ